MEFVSTENRKQKIIDEDYIYTFQKNLANNIRSYECELQQRGQFIVKIKVDLGVEIGCNTNEHTHPPFALTSKLCRSAYNCPSSQK